jgi:galactokinase
MYPDSVEQSFRKTFGTAPAVVVRAPGRINIIGEHTDYNEGFVLPAAIDKAIWFAVSPRNDRQLRLEALDYGDACVCSLDELQKHEKGWPDYLLGAFSELIRAGHHIGGANVVFGGDIPVGAGLSSSAAVESGMLFALDTLYGLGIDRPGLARLAQRAENNFVGMNCGIMDMFASLMGRAQHAMRLDCRSLDTAYFNIQSNDHCFILCNSGVKHQLVDSEYNTRRRECEEGVAILKTAYPGITHLRDVDEAMLTSEQKNLPERVYRRCRFVVEENRRVLDACAALENGDSEGLGRLLSASHRGLQYEYEVTCPETDFLADCAQQHPAVQGARQMGGGFGGCTLNLVERGAVKAFQEWMGARYRENTQRDLICYQVEITDGVGRVRNMEKTNF